MVRCRVFLPSLCTGIFIIGSLLAQQSDEVRQRPVEIRNAEAVETPTPGETPTAKKKSKGGKHSTPASSPKSTRRPKHQENSEDDAADETPRAHAEAKTRASKAKPSETPAADDETPTPKAKKSPPGGKGKKKKAAHTAKASPAKDKSAAKKKSNPDSAEPAETAVKKAEKPAETPSPRTSTSPARTTLAPKPSAPPAPIPALTNAPNGIAEEPEQLTIEKSGYEKPRTFWQRVFGSSRGNTSGAGYRYLSRSVRSEIDRVGADRRNPRWQLIVVHNSGTRQGNARVFDYYHRHVRHMQNGLAYHFVIGNGTSTGNGEVEVGDRWRRQINGGHVHSDYLNNIAVGICLVGDFNRDQPTRAQLECCEELIRYLRQRCGKIENHFPLVKPHREVNPPRWATDCPGDAFPYSWFRRFRE